MEDRLMKIRTGTLKPEITPLTLYDGLKQYLVSENEDSIGKQWIFRSGNIGASVIKNQYSYGIERDLFEVAYVTWKNNNFEIDTNKVYGYLTNNEVNELLKKILGI